MGVPAHPPAPRKIQKSVQELSSVYVVSFSSSFYIFVSREKRGSLCLPQHVCRSDNNLRSQFSPGTKGLRD